MCGIVLMVVVMWWSSTSTAIRVDDKDGFVLCNVPQVAQIQEVEVKECNKWPCVAQAGRSGTYKITFTQQSDEVMFNIQSDIYAWVRLPFVHGGKRPVRVAIPGEKRKPLCRYATPACPVKPGVPTTITKSVTIPLQARMAQGNVLVEFIATDEQDQVVICFRAPVVVA
ncbi:hypothetical protein OTU49_007725 [Cherax quadricarinatus]|uniref:MD-2-related lipid-recognition domain-containing protein n=1 Tax=Cherax quadricarinatus TaxID=27406 RepID=A0AAW0WVH5_CHEQU|nr:uncharacterized protein LOC128687179 [Cherax quadricarinatus]